MMCKSCHEPVVCARFHRCLKRLAGRDLIVQEYGTTIMVIYMPDHYIDSATISPMDARTILAPDSHRACQDLTADEASRALELMGLA